LQVRVRYPVCGVRIRVRQHERDRHFTDLFFFPQCYGTVWCDTLAHRAPLAFCPARANPFWIKKGVCPLHDLDSRLGSEVKKHKKKHLQVQVRYPVCGVRMGVQQRECDRHFTDLFFFPQCYGTVWCGTLAHQARLAFCPAQAHARKLHTKKLHNASLHKITQNYTMPV
jgi:ssDNA-binding Zn-finger/Zn-ribbon topoisomerase 1